MGASESKLTSGYTVQTTWDKQGTAFTVQRAITKATNSSVTVFSYKKSVQDTDDVNLLGKAVQRLRTIRHPGIIKFINGQADDKGVVMVTEPVTPLSETLATLPEEDICVGLYNVIKTIDFLHSQELSHNNIQMSSIYVTDSDHRWVVGGMEYATSFDDSAAEILPKLHQHYPEDAIPPEDTAPPKEGTQPDARDVYSLGKLISSVIASFVTASEAREGKHNGFDWLELQLLADRLIAPIPEDRPRVVDVLRSPWFEENVLINVVELFLKEIRVIDPHVKRMRFKHLPEELRSLSLPTLTSYVLPLILSEEFASEPGVDAFFEQLFVPHVEGQLQNVGILPVFAYDEHILPFIESMLRIRTYNVRIIMLSLFNCYLNELLQWEHTLLQNLIIPELMAGLEETDDTIYLLSLCALTEATNRLCLDMPNPTSSTKPGALMNDLTTEEAPVRGVLGIKSTLQEGRPPAGPPGIPRAVRKKLVSSPTKTPTGEGPRPLVKRNISMGLLPGAGDWGNSKDAGVASVRAKRQSIALGSAPTEPSPATSSHAEGTDRRYTPQLLVENHLIPHTLSVCVQETISFDQKWMILDAIVTLWKSLCIAEGTNKASSDVRYLTTSILKCFHLILKVLPPTMKTEFYCNRLVGDATRSLESSSMHWQARTIDLGTPFIKDDNRDVRRQISQTVLNVITVIAAAMDRAPTIARKRDESSVANKLRKVYDRLSRTRTVFPRTGPRSSAVLSQPPIRSVVRDREQPTALSAQSSTADLYGGGVPSATWDDGHWSDEFEAADEQRLHPEPFVESPASEEQQEAFAPPLIPDPKAEEEREAEKQMRLEKLKAKREAREAELRLKRERKKSLVTSIKTECSASAVTCDSNHTDCALSNETNQAESPLDTSSPAPLEQSLSVIVGVPLTKSKDPELAEEMDYFRDMEPAIPAPTLLVLEHLADMHSKASQEASPALGQSPQPNISTPPLLTPTSSRLAMLEVVTDDVVGSGWGHDGLSDFDD